MSTSTGRRTNFVDIFLYVLIIGVFLYFYVYLWSLRGKRGHPDTSPITDVFLKHPLVRDVDCAPFFQTVTNQTERITADGRNISETDCVSIFDRHYFSKSPFSDEERDFPFAVIRVVYRDYVMLEQMLAVQYCPQNTYCYAIDSKSSPEFKEALRNLAGCFHNVHVAEKELDLDSSGHNMNQAHWECVKEIRNKSWNYVFLLQNHDIPLRTNLETVRILKMLNGCNDVEFGPFPGQNRVSPNSTFTFASLKLFNNESLNTNETLKLAKGGVQAAFSRKAIDFMLNEMSIENLIAELNKGSSWVDETFAATVNTDPTIALPGGFSRVCVEKGISIPPISKSALWYDASKCLSGVMRHSVCVFGVEDLPRISTLPQIFLNKLLPETDFLAFSCLAESVFNRTMRKSTLFDKSFYENASVVRFQANPDNFRCPRSL